MIYEQLLDSIGTRGARLKRAFQIIGFLHFFLGFVFSLFLVFIFWKLALIPFSFGLLGFAWGSVSYLFSSDFKYVFKEGKFEVSRLNSNRKYKLKLECDSRSIRFVEKASCIVLTNQKDRIYIEVDGVVFAISPDDYMLSLLKNGN